MSQVHIHRLSPQNSFQYSVSWTRRRFFSIWEENVNLSWWRTLQYSRRTPPSSTLSINSMNEAFADIEALDMSVEKILIHPETLKLLFKDFQRNGLDSRSVWGAKIIGDKKIREGFIEVEARTPQRRKLSAQRLLGPINI